LPFSDELPKTCFLPKMRATRLRRQTFLFSEFLERHAPGIIPRSYPEKFYSTVIDTTKR